MSDAPRAQIPRPTDIDLDIFRTLYRTGGVSIAGVDPRLNASRIAERLGVSRARVAARLADWSRYGLLQRYDVWPNPAYFGRLGATLDVRLTDRFAKSELFERVALIEGAVGGIEFAGEWSTIQFLGRDEADLARTVALVRGLAGIAEVGPLIPWVRLPIPRPLSPLDLRIVRVLRRYPKEPLAVIARHVGVSTRTITTRYGQLLDALAVWFVPILDFRALGPPVVSLNVQLDRGVDRAAVARAVRKEYPQSLELGQPGFGPEMPAEVAVFFVLCPSAARVEELEGFVRRVPGVLGVEGLTLVQVRSFPGTFDRLLHDAGTAARAPVPAPTPRGRGPRGS